MSKTRIAVVGAGPAGITAAYELAKRGFPADVFEASEHVGGMARTIELWNQKVDLGPHRFFSSDPRVNKIWLEVAGRDYSMVDRLTRIYYKGRYFHYPLKAANALINLGVFEAVRCVVSYLVQRTKGQAGVEHATFENWVVSRFGRRLFEIFFKAYSEKLWGITCQELDAEFAAQRIKKLSLWEAAKNAVFGAGGNKHKTLVDRFAYPKQGTGSIYERMAESVKAKGGTIRLKSPVRRVLNSGTRATGLELTTGERIQYDHVISSMPLTQMVRALDGCPQNVLNACNNLRFRNTILVYLKVEATELFPDNWLYVHSPDLQMGRVTNFRNWVPELYAEENSTILCLEYWCYDNDPIWTEKDSPLIELAKKEIRATGLIVKAEIAAGHVVRIPKCYPVYQTGYKTHLQVVTDYLKTYERLTLIGRYGAFKYNNQDHSILMGLFAAENIASSARNDLWDVNTDYEYQEKATITESGLHMEGQTASP